MKMMRRMLERSGYKVLSARTGKEAIEFTWAYDKEINLALLDFILPDINGDIIYPLIQRHHPEMEVIILSGYGFTDRIQHTLDAGAKIFIEKPVTMKDLANKIYEII
ncbi:MAG: response regulator [Desulfobacteraceae bacterium]|nr:response regulator [Desulfobacteraceae bacterium]